MWVMSRTRAILAAALVAAPGAELAAQPVAPVAQPFPGQVWMPPPPQPVRPQPSPAPWLVTVWLPIIGAAVAMAAQQQQRQREEEEEVTPVETEGPTSYEYKILRSASGAFKTREKMKAALEEEARAGWELYELLDTSRLRLRRSVACRARDDGLTQDPYRTRVGASDGAIALRIVLVTLLVIGLVLAAVLVVVKR